VTCDQSRQEISLNTAKNADFDVYGKDQASKLALPNIQADQENGLQRSSLFQALQAA
jgi:hypothetical protein